MRFYLAYFVLFALICFTGAMTNWGIIADEAGLAERVNVTNSTPTVGPLLNVTVSLITDIDALPEKEVALLPAIAIEDVGVLPAAEPDVTIAPTPNVELANTTEKMTSDWCGGYMPCHCGDTVIANTVLTSDLLNCPGDGLIISTPGVTLNCNGHSLTGGGTGITVYYADGVSIYDCDISHFGVGIETFSSNQVTIQYNKLSHHNYGIMTHDGNYLNIGNNLLTIMDGGMNIGMELYGLSYSNIYQNEIRNIPGWGIRALSISNNFFMNNYFIGVWNEAVDEQGYKNEAAVAPLKEESNNYWIGNTWSYYHYIMYDEDNHPYYASNPGYPRYYSIPGNKEAKDYSPRQYVPSYTKYFSINKAGPTMVCGTITAYDNFFGRYVTPENIDYGIEAVIELDLVCPSTLATYIGNGNWQYCIDYSEYYLPNGTYPLAVYVNGDEGKIQYFSITENLTSVAGHVYAANGDALQDAQVLIYRTYDLNNPIRSTSTDSLGHFQINSLIKGTYYIGAKHSGYKDSIKNVLVLAGNSQMTEYDLTLQPLTPYLSSLDGLMRRMYYESNDLMTHSTGMMQATTDLYRSDMDFSPYGDPDPAIDLMNVMLSYPPNGFAANSFNSFIRLKQGYPLSSLMERSIFSKEMVHGYVLVGLQTWLMDKYRAYYSELKDDVLQDIGTDLFQHQVYKNASARLYETYLDFKQKSASLQVNASFDLDKAENLIKNQIYMKQLIILGESTTFMCPAPDLQLNQVSMGAIYRDYFLRSQALNAYGGAASAFGYLTLTTNLGANYGFLSGAYSSAMKAGPKTPIGLLLFELAGGSALFTFYEADMRNETALFYGLYAARGWMLDLVTILQQYESLEELLLEEAATPNYLDTGKTYSADVEIIEKNCGYVDYWGGCGYYVTDIHGNEHRWIRLNIKNTGSETDVKIVPRMEVPMDNPMSLPLGITNLHLKQGEERQQVIVFPVYHVNNRNQDVVVDVFLGATTVKEVHHTFDTHIMLPPQSKMGAGMEGSAVYFSLTPENESFEFNYTANNDSSMLLIELFSSSLATTDLHISEGGFHAGFDYDSGQVQIGIPALHSKHGVIESWLIPEPANKEFTISTRLRDFAGEGPFENQLLIREEANLGGFFAFSPKSVAVYGNPGQTVGLSLEILEVGGQAPIEEINIEASNLTKQEGGIVIWESGDSFSYLSAGESKTLTNTYRIPQDADFGNYTGKINITTQNQSFSQDILIQVAGSRNASIYLIPGSYTIEVNKSAGIDFLMRDESGRPEVNALAFVYPLNGTVLEVATQIVSTGANGIGHFQVLGLNVGISSLIIRDIADGFANATISVIPAASPTPTPAPCVPRYDKRTGTWIYCNIS
ncbi:MAG: carboxypeptidase regulatory-like domain-containing protein [Candidatus Micrarchaeota archaeon]